MAESIPYLASPGSIRTALEKIATAATPERVTGDFVQTILGIKGGTGRAIIPFLKKIGLVGPDGSPTDLYKRFRNTSTGGGAIADAVKFGYQALKAKNEYFYKLNDGDLRALLIEVTGKPDGSVVEQTFRTLKVLKSFAKFDAGAAEKEASIVPAAPTSREPAPEERRVEGRTLGLNLSYTINLNLPATSDQAVFNAIFRSLKENLITDVQE